jgi:hypothetical protein
MPSWDTATSRRVQDEKHDVELEKMLPHNSAYNEPYQETPRQPQYNDQYGGDIGSVHNYDDHRQFAPASIYSQQSTAYPGQTRVTSPVSAYEPSIAAPSYHTYAPAQSYGQTPITRKAAPGTWRDV